MHNDPKLERLASFLDSQLDKLHVLVNKPQDIDFEDVTEAYQINEISNESLEKIADMQNCKAETTEKGSFEKTLSLNL